MRRVKLLVSVVVMAAASMGTAPANVADTAGLPVEPGVLQAERPLRVLMRFEERVPDELLVTSGLEVHYRFQSLPAISATASPAALRAIAAHPDLAYLEADKPIEFDLDSATVASRSKDVVDPSFDPGTPVLTGPDGEAIDGTGVGVAVVDTGLDGLHPDFQEPGKVGANYLVVPTGPVSAPNTAFTHVDSGHGTHVAGIAVGTGTLSKQRGGPVYEGVAPGATVYAFNMFAGPLVSSAAIVFDWIIRNGADQDPPIRVVNNSWHCGLTACGNPSGGQPLHIQLATQMAEAGFVVTWSAGNDQGDGWQPTTNVEARNLTPGIISVANYKDDGWNDPSLPPGTREACLSGDSAWGASSDPTTWPDLAAPGRSVWSTFAFGVDRTGTAGLDYRDPITNENAYKRMSGTSMAAPHMAGVVALLLQANPHLSPAEVEYILKQTATPLVGPTHEDGCGIDYIRADISHPWNGANYAAGHGLVHAYDAVDMAIGFTGIPDPIENEEIPASFIVGRPGIQAERTFYFTGETGLSETYPEAGAPRALALEPNTSMTFESHPVAADITVDALEIHPYIGTSGEYFAKFNGPRLRTRVERETTDGARLLIAEDLTNTWQISPLGPTDRDVRIVLDEPVTIVAGERLRVTVSLISPPFVGAIDPPTHAYWTLYWERPFTSRLVLGGVIEKPAFTSRASCESREDCAMVDVDHEYENLTCGATIYSLSWFGPPGSSLIFGCGSTYTTCTVAGVPGDEWDSCETEWQVTLPPDNAYRAGVCFYRMPDGSRGGSGRCVGQEIVED